MDIFSKLNSKEKKLKVEEELRQLTIDYENMGKMVQKKTDQLVESNRLLQVEIVARKKMEIEILEIAQAEQKRFGSQLHDGLCQELAAILVFAKTLAHKMEKNNTLEIDELKKISEMLLDAVDEARDTAHGLYPGELEGKSLMFSLEELASSTIKAKCVFICPEPIIINNNDMATHLYRITQEGISNAIKHGKAQNIEISFIKNENKIILSIKDDGIGLENGFQNSKGIGLKIMKYRADMMDASFSVSANTPKGVILECIFKNFENKKELS